MFACPGLEFVLLPTELTSLVCGLPSSVPLVSALPFLSGGRNACWPSVNLCLFHMNLRTNPLRGCCTQALSWISPNLKLHCVPPGPMPIALPKPPMCRPCTALFNVIPQSRLTLLSVPNKLPSLILTSKNVLWSRRKPFLGILMCHLPTLLVPCRSSMRKRTRSGLNLVPMSVLVMLFPRLPSPRPSLTFSTPLNRIGLPCGTNMLMSRSRNGMTSLTLQLAICGRWPLPALRFRSALCVAVFRGNLPGLPLVLTALEELICWPCWTPTLNFSFVPFLALGRQVAGLSKFSMGTSAHLPRQRNLFVWDTTAL